MKKLIFLLCLILFGLAAKPQYVNVIDDYNGKGYIKASSTALVFRFMSGDNFYISKGDLMIVELSNDSIAYLENTKDAFTGNDINGWNKSNNYAAIKAVYVSIDTTGKVLNIDFLKKYYIEKITIYTSNKTIESELDQSKAKKVAMFLKQ